MAQKGVKFQTSGTDVMTIFSGANRGFRSLSVAHKGFSLVT
jgi:hypothetical protein